MHLSAYRLAGGKWNGFKILRQLADLSDFGRRSQKEIFILPVELGQCANNVSRISADTEFIDPANVDGDLHRVNLITERDVWPSGRVPGPKRVADAQVDNS